MNNHVNSSCSRSLRLQKGFTLIELIIALAILSISIGWILRDQTEAVKKSVRSRLLSQAIYLARAKMDNTEMLMRKEGFGSFEDEFCGEFADDGYEEVDRFEYCVLIEKIIIPDINRLQEELLGGQNRGEEGDIDPETDGATPSPISNLIDQFMPGMGGDSELGDSISSMAGRFLAPALSSIQNVLEEAVRKVTVTVRWKAAGKMRQMELVAYYTDTNELTRSLISPGNIPNIPGVNSGTGGKNQNKGSPNPGESR
ncbi:MAG: type IV pilus modification PilV family protein [Myxococcota bacterium]